jgi:ATP-dependent RNA helicase RhlE
MPETQISGGFAALGLPSYLVEKLSSLGITEPTPIQQGAIPPALKGQDVVGIAQTGTGKTLAFGLPMAVALRQGGTGLVLAPTRELAIQILESLYQIGIRGALLIGGAPMMRQIQQLRSNPDVVVATPGRLKDHMAQRTIDLSNVSIAVLDEADRMLDMGFAPVIRLILAATPSTRQTMLFSATMPREIAELAATHVRNPVRIEITPSGTAPTAVEQDWIVVPKDQKPHTLARLLEETKGSVLIFARTRHGACRLTKSVRLGGHSAAEIHSDRTLAQRTNALSGFKSGEYRVLVATDIAARGIDVKDISLVINYDVPECPEDYVHRIGRTGRAGAGGRAITLVTPEQGHHARDIERLLGKLAPQSPHAKPAGDPRRETQTHGPRRHRGGANRRGR